MALETSYSLSEEFGGLVINGVYARITRLTIDITRDKYVDVELALAASKDLRNSGQYFKQGLNISIPNEWFAKTKLNKDDLLKKAYDYLKTMPEFKDAVDI